MFADPTYRGAEAFSEPETQNIRELVSSRQVTTLITNHTFSNLVLRPNGVSPDTIHPATGMPVGNPPDAAALEISLVGPTLQAGCELACVLYGAPFALNSDQRPLQAGTTFTLKPFDWKRLQRELERLGLDD